MSWLHQRVRILGSKRGLQGVVEGARQVLKVGIFLEDLLELLSPTARVTFLQSSLQHEGSSKAIAER